MCVSEETQAEPGTKSRGCGTSAASSAIPEEDDPDNPEEDDPDSPEEDDPGGGIEPGTPLAEIAGEWVCPVRGARETDIRELVRDDPGGRGKRIRDHQIRQLRDTRRDAAVGRGGHRFRARQRGVAGARRLRE